MLNTYVGKTLIIESGVIHFSPKARARSEEAAIALKKVADGDWGQKVKMMWLANDDTVNNPQKPMPLIVAAHEGLAISLLVKETVSAAGEKQLRATEVLISTEDEPKDAPVQGQKYY